MTAKAFKPAPDPKPCTRYDADPSQGADWRGWYRCGTCPHWGKPGDPRDKRHPDPAAADGATPTSAIPRSLRRRVPAHVIAAAAAIEARRLGETGDDD